MIQEKCKKGWFLGFCACLIQSIKTVKTNNMYLKGFCKDYNIVSYLKNTCESTNF